MKKRILIANWKSNKTTLEAIDWIRELASFKLSFNSNVEIIVCPSFPLLPKMQETIKSLDLPIKLGAQNISPYDEGAYTGEVNGKQIKEFADYVLLGHSERRKYFSVNKDIITKQAEMANKNELSIIYCASDVDDFVPSGVDLLVYEPPTAISPAPADTPENAEAAALVLNQKYNKEHIIYGGNVTAQNVEGFMNMPHINGVLVGRASLNAKEFSTIIEQLSAVVS